MDAVDVLWTTFKTAGRASLAMVDGRIVPVAPRQFRIWRVTAEPSLGY